MTPLIFASAMALFRATLSSPDPLFPTDGTGGGPTPVNGVWAGLPADCEQPASIDLSTWPKCAQPVGFLDGQIAVLEKPGPNNKAKADEFYSIARTKFWTIKATDSAPAIVQVDIPILFNHSTIYIAVKPDAVDERGGFIAATGWPVSCPPTAVAGLQNDNGHCTAMTTDGVRAAAAVQPSDPKKLYRLVRIIPEAAPAMSAPPAPTTSAPTAPAQAPVPAPSAEPTELPPIAAPEGSTPSTPPTAAPGDVQTTSLPPPGEAGSSN